MIAVSLYHYLVASYMSYIIWYNNTPPQWEIVLKDSKSWKIYWPLIKEICARCPLRDVNKHGMGLDMLNCTHDLGFSRKTLGVACVAWKLLDSVAEFPANLEQDTQSCSTGRSLHHLSLSSLSRNILIHHPLTIIWSTTRTSKHKPV